LNTLKDTSIIVTNGLHKLCVYIRIFRKISPIDSWCKLSAADETYPMLVLMNGWDLYKFCSYFYFVLKSFDAVMQFIEKYFTFPYLLCIFFPLTIIKFRLGYPKLQYSFLGHKKRSQSSSCDVFSAMA